MSKVWDDEEIRNATAEEQEQIDAQGGGSSRYELIREVVFNEDTHVVRLQRLKGYDSIFFEVSGLKGTNSTPLNLYTYNGLGTAALQEVLTMSETTASNTNVEFDRKTPNTWFQTYGSNKCTFRKAQADSSYENKITQVDIIAGNYNGNGVIKEGTIRVYGKVITNE